MTLLHPDEYTKHLNEVAGLTTRDIKFLKRQFAPKADWELVTCPIAECGSISYNDERHISLRKFYRACVSQRTDQSAPGR